MNKSALKQKTCKKICKYQNMYISLRQRKDIIMSKKEKEEKAKEFWKYYEATQCTIIITDPIVLD